jgi:hypothetical protein
MQEWRRGGFAGEIVGGLERKAQVRDVQGCRDTVGADVRDAQRRQHERRDGDGHEQAQRGSGQQPPGTSCVERDQGDGARPFELADEEPRDQEAGEDKEDVHADVTAGHEGKTGMEEEHQDDRDAAQALQVGPEAVGARLRGGCRGFGERGRGFDRCRRGCGDRHGLGARFPRARFRRRRG